MPLAKKAIILIISSIFFISLFSGCIDQILGGVSFTLDSWEIVDEQGFPAISFTYTCSGTVYLRLITPGSTEDDTEYFLSGSGEGILHLSEYKHSTGQGSYNLKVTDKSGDELYSKSFSIQGDSLTINSCQQHWWKQQFWMGSYDLVGLSLEVKNSGDTPSYPYQLSILMDSEEINGYIIPTIIQPDETKTINCFIYKDGEATEAMYDVFLKDYEGNVMANGSFSNNVVDNIDDEEFNWNHNGNRRIYLPKINFLYNYYKNLDRYESEDYALFVLDPIDDAYIEILVDSLLFGYNNDNDVDKVNYVTSFVQSLEYITDAESDSELEYPRYPLETLFTGNGGGDCEDKAILTASILYNMGYNVTLIRLPDHMAVGINLAGSALPGKNYFLENYFFLETTTQGNTCGNIPGGYESQKTEATLHKISSRPVLIHNWKDDNIVIYKGSDLGSFVKATCIVTNLGSSVAEDITIEAAYYSLSGLKINDVEDTISSLEPQMSKKIIISSDIPGGLTTIFKTKVILDEVEVDEAESIDTFP